jgi:hypothetical protein
MSGRASFHETLLAHTHLIGGEGDAVDTLLALIGPRDARELDRTHQP